MLLLRRIAPLLILCLLTPQSGFARPKSDLVSLGRLLVSDIYARSARLSYPTYLVEIQEFAEGEEPTRARFLLRDKNPCCADSGTDVIEVYLVMAGGRLVGFAAKGSLFDTLAQSSVEERDARRTASLKAVLRFMGWRDVLRSGPDPNDPDRELVVFETGQRLTEQHGYFDRRSGLPVRIGVAF